ncbi:MAG: DUF2878 domain-containing protein, partial [Gammaproteobacteria bacterium]
MSAEPGPVWILRAWGNFLLFQAGWFLAVPGAGAGLPWAGVVFALLWLPLHLLAVARDDDPGWRRELTLIGVAVALGAVLDSALVLAGALSFPESVQLGAPTTLWMLALWAMFAATLRFSLSWLRGRLVLAALFGLVGGPLAYLGGERLDAIVIHATSGVVGVALAWGLAAPLLVW